MCGVLNQGEGNRKAGLASILTIQPVCCHTSSHFCLLLIQWPKSVYPQQHLLTRSSGNVPHLWPWRGVGGQGGLSTGFHRPSHPPFLAPHSSHIPCQAVGVKLILDFGWLIRSWRAPSGEGLGLVGIIVVGAISLRCAGKAEDDSSNEGEQGGNNAQVKSLSDLKFHAVRHQWGVEVPQDPMKIPGNRDEAQETTKDEEDSTHYCHSVLGLGVLAEDCASHAHHRDNAGQRGDCTGCHHHGLGSLDVSGQT